MGADQIPPGHRFVMKPALAFVFMVGELHGLVEFDHVDEENPSLRGVLDSSTLANQIFELTSRLQQWEVSNSCVAL